MVDFTHEYSSFPQTVIEKQNFKDVDEHVYDIINQLKEFQASGKFKEASELIKNNHDLLKPYVIDTSFINKLIEEIRNTEIYALAARQSVYISDDEPYVSMENDVWIGGE